MTLFQDQILKPTSAALHGMTLQDQKSRTDMDYVARTVPTLPRVTTHART